MVKLDKEQWKLIHKDLAVNLFNETWDLIDKEDRNSDEDIKMIHLAHSSLYHWSQCGDPKNISIGEWQISKVYFILGMKESSLKHALYNIDFCQNHDIEGFELGYAYESAAKVYLSMGEVKKAKMYKELGIEEAKKVESKEDHLVLFEDLNNIRL